MFEFDPPSHAQDDLVVTPFFGNNAYIVRLENVGNNTVLIDTGSWTMVTTNGLSVSLPANALSASIPPGSHTYIETNGSTIREYDPEFRLKLLYRTAEVPTSGTLFWSVDRMQRAMETNVGEIVQLRFVYQVGATTRERIISFGITGTQVVD